ncbi:transcriptional regulator [Actinomadura sp. WAC 06369]|nr:transcriptional regulator [Actinomadura sp. WAC 06369]
MTSIPIDRVLPGESPRLGGEDEQHVFRLAAAEGPLPPILVDQKTMRVVDGAHRLRAALLNGRRTIDVQFFDGSREDAFLRAVEANIEQGLPLTRADRIAAALRILKSHPEMSDRAVAKSTGIGTRAVATLRRSSGSVSESGSRIGRDGKVRPLSGAQGRLRVAEFIRQNPDASLRQVARAAGVSPATALDVRRRLARGEDPVPTSGGAGDCGKKNAKDAPATERPAPAGAPSKAALDKLMRDPSLRQNELGRRLLRLLKEHEMVAKELSDIAAWAPTHCIHMMVELSRHNSQVWDDFAQDLKQRSWAVKID